MSDILTILDQQTTQTQALILRLSERLTQTQQLQQLEIERRKTEARVTQLEAHLRDIDIELGRLRQQATCFDPAQLRTATVHLDQVWQSACGIEAVAPTAPGISIRPVEPIPAGVAVEPPTTRPVESTPAVLTAEPPTTRPVESTPAVLTAEPPTTTIAPLDAETVLGSFFLGGNEWGAAPTPTDFFSAAQELGGETDLDDWWQEEPAADQPPAQDYLADDFGFSLNPPVPELAGAMMMEPAPVAQNEGRKKGLLGRFF